MNFNKYIIVLISLSFSNWAFSQKYYSPIHTNTPVKFLDYQIKQGEIEFIYLSEPSYHFKWNQTADGVEFITDSLAPFMCELKISLKNHKNITIPIIKSSKKKMRFQLVDESNRYQKVQIKGTFNSWNPNNLNLNKVGKYWVGESFVGDGSHQFVYVLDGKKEIRDPYYDSVSNGMGGYNSAFINKFSEIYLTGESIVKSKIKLQFQSADTDNSEIRIIALDGNVSLNAVITNASNKSELEVYLTKEQLDNRVHYIRVWVYSRMGYSNEVIIPISGGNIIRDFKKISQEMDPHSMIIYNPMIDRFFDGNKNNNISKPTEGVLPKVDFMGGDIVGITKKIEDGYFDRLGVNTLWVSPIIKNPMDAWGLWPNPKTKFSAYHGYWPISSTETDSRFCTADEFRQFLNVAHKRNIRVLVDYVAHHVHQTHPLVKQHPDWFTSLYLPDGTKNTERWDEYRLTTWFDDFLPTLDFSKPEVVEAMTDSAVWWAKNFDIDGFRHDATKHIPEIFWKTLTQKLKTQIKNKELFQIGETYGSSELIGSYLGTGMLDAQFDFNVYDASVAAFKGSGNMRNLVSILNDSKRNYGANHLMGNITGNQDRPRFVSLADLSLKEGDNFKQAGWDRDIELRDLRAVEKLQQLFAFNIAIPGIPVIYYGDEIAVPGANDPDCRRMMRFGNDKTPNDSLTELEQNHRNIFCELIQLRKKYMSLIYGDCTFEAVDDTKLCITRKYFGEKVKFYFNNGSENWILKNETSNTMVFGIANNQISKLSANHEEMIIKPLAVLIVVEN